jgi:CHAT domain-containing protein
LRDLTGESNKGNKMKERIWISKHKLLQFILSILICFSLCSTIAVSAPALNNGALTKLGYKDKAQEKSILKLSLQISWLYSSGRLNGLLPLSDSLINSLGKSHPDSLYLADIYYYIGVCNLLAEKHSQTIGWLEHSLTIREKMKLKDTNLAKTLYNLALSYNYFGDYDKVVRYALEYINCQRELSGKDCGDVAEEYAILAGISFEAKNYEDFISYSFSALDIISKNPRALDRDKLCSLYTTIGSGYASMGDYAKGRIYLEQAENIFKKSLLKPSTEYINLINSLAITYGNLGMTEKESEYIVKGVELAAYDKSMLSLNMLNTYAIGLGKEGKTEKGEALLIRITEKAKKIYGPDSRFYAEMLNDYASFMLHFGKDPQIALKLYSECFNILHNDSNQNLKNIVGSGYAEALYHCGDSELALGYIQKLLFNTDDINKLKDPYQNPSVDSLNIDRTSLDLLDHKYEILRSLFSKSNDRKVLEAAAGTSELMITLLDKIRFNISEEDSRLILGNRFRDLYLNAIRDFDQCYRITGKNIFLEKAFEFAEKSKVASLLTATRELNAIQFHIPQKTAELEKSLQNKIGFYNSRISKEENKETPDLSIISEFKEKLLTIVRERDSLLQMFEKSYPGYYALKYSSNVPTVKDIPSIIGRNNNYLNYVLSDSVIYIFLVNRKNVKMQSFRIDSAFITELRDFRKLLSDQSVSINARIKFNEYKKAGYDLYKILIGPVRKSFISDNLIISPDNILSYLPFETLLTKDDDVDDLYYRDLDYLMNDFNVSYTYSATFMNEYINRESNSLKDLVSFAPVYTRSINTDSLFIGRQSGSGVLYDLPEARQEAEYISKITGGDSFLFGEAKESVFKRVAGNYRIIHLAMHTYLNDQNPMNSAMIFSQGNDSPEDGLLYTYEVYGIPMNARMVVLSSCNTGNGILSSGEGILSLARGFIYSGCQSVVMSMWEIDDKSGTEVMKMFYDNLLKGKSKAQALKASRREYLKNASQLRSHPYFWSSLVVYGENGPVFSKHWTTLIVSGLAGLFVIFLFIYFPRRRNS